VEPEERHSFGEEALRCIHTAEVAVSVVMSAQPRCLIDFSSVEMHLLVTPILLRRRSRLAISTVVGLW
jgi:hypothetical protein